jgi:hypothetical protein
MDEEAISRPIMSNLGGENSRKENEIDLRRKVERVLVSVCERAVHNQHS